MRRFVFTLVSLLLVTITLYATSPVKGLGGNFSLLVPDKDFDSSVFPNLVVRFKAGYVNYSTDGNSFNTLLKFGNYTSKHSCEIEASDYSYGKYNNYRSTQKSDFQFSNILAKQTPNRSIGVFHSLEKKTTDVIRGDRNYNYGSFEYERYREKVENNDVISNTMGISWSLGRSQLSSIALIYTLQEQDRDSDNWSLRNYVNNDEYPDEYRVNLKLQKSEIENHEYKLYFLKEFGVNNSLRFFSKFSFMELKFDDKDSTINEEYDLDYNGNPSFSQDIEEIVSYEDSELYLTQVGLSKHIKHKKMNFYLAGKVKLSASKSEYGTYQKDINFEADEDTTYSESSHTPQTREESAVGFYTEFPLGMSYQPAKWVKLYASVTATIEVHKSSASNVIDNNDPFWSSKSGQNLGLEIYPLDKLELGVYHIYDLSQYKNWEFTIKYTF